MDLRRGGGGFELATVEEEGVQAAVLASQQSTFVSPPSLSLSLRLWRAVTTVSSLALLPAGGVPAGGRCRV